MSIITQRGNLAEIVANELTSRIDNGIYRVGEKIPPSIQLCEEFGVSRTVIREAVASLKLSGRVNAKQGAGVFVNDQTSGSLLFEINSINDVRSAMQILELRIGIELQSVALAAARRTPEALVDIARAYDRLDHLDGSNLEEEVKADFDFHMAIARAALNPHFPHFLEVIMNEINLDLFVKHHHALGSDKNYLKKINKQHAAILSAITQGDVRGAQSAMKNHLEESLKRYRKALETQ